MIQEAGRRYGDLSYMLGARSWQERPDGTNIDGERKEWMPNLRVVRAVIH